MQAIILNLKNIKAAIIAGVAATATLALMLYLMKNLPGTDGTMCAVGMNFTFKNIVFAIFLSVSAGLALAGLSIISFTKKNASITGTSGMAAIIGIMTSFCTICTLPIISLFGISVSVYFITEHSTIVQIISVILMLLSLYLIDKQLKTKKCSIKGICNIRY